MHTHTAVSMHASQHYKTEIYVYNVSNLLPAMQCNIASYIMQCCSAILSFSISGSIQVLSLLVPNC